MHDQCVVDIFPQTTASRLAPAHSIASLTFPQAVRTYVELCRVGSEADLPIGIRSARPDQTSPLIPPALPLSFEPNLKQNFLIRQHEARTRLGSSRASRWDCVGGIPDDR